MAGPEHGSRPASRPLERLADARHATLYLPWLEVTLGLIVGLVLFLLEKREIAQITWLLGAFLSFSRLAYARHLDSALAPVKRLAQTVDLDSSLDLDEVRDLARVYSHITEPEFLSVKRLVVQEAVGRLRQLAYDKTSGGLTSGEYYAWLLPILESMGRGDEIWAISVMLDWQWDNSSSHNRFIEANIAAARRGATVRRIFVVPQSKMSGLAQSPGVHAHVRSGKNRLRGFCVTREYLEARDPELLRHLGGGLIAFNRRVAVIGLVTPGDQVGRVTMNPIELGSLRRMFDSLFSHAEGLPG